MALPNLRYFRDDLRMTTWLLIGACLQASLLIILPPRIAILPTLLLLSSRVVAFLMIRQGVLPDASMKNVRVGRYSTQIPQADGSLAGRPSDQDVVVMILGAQSNHIQGRFAPGFQEMGDAFGDMWREASKHREEYGYFGKTSTLFGTDFDSGNTMVWISYWKSADHLHKWALEPIHRKGMDAFVKYQKENSHIALMHEMYAVPKKHWETIYINFKPFGFGQTKHVTEESKLSNGTVSSLRKADDPSWKTSLSRMGQLGIGS